MFIRNFISSTFSGTLSYFTTRDNEKPTTMPSKEKSNFRYALDSNEEKKLTYSQSKPKIVALYDVNDGASNADLAIKQFEKVGIEVVKVPPAEGLQHPIFASRDNHLNGIYLPGGSDIPVSDTQDQRSKFEGQLIEKARTEDIPLLGICRGEQAIGHHNNLAVNDINDYNKHYYDHDAPKNENSSLNNAVIVVEGSQLYSSLQQEFKNEKQNTFFEYAVTCLHHQHIPDNVSNQVIAVSARNKFDNTIEAIEISTGEYCSVGLQHHPEVTLDAFEKSRESKILQIERDAEIRSLSLNYIDPDYTLYSTFRVAEEIRKANIQSSDERAARAELSLFTSQVKMNRLKEIAPDDKNDNTRLPQNFSGRKYTE